MEVILTQDDLKKIETYRNKKFINILRKLTDEEINTIVNSSVVEFIASLDINIINSIFRNCNATMQNKLWANDTIQKVLILGNKSTDNFVCNEQTIRNLENLNKIIKSRIIKKQIYTNKYFLMIVIYGNNIENRFFYSYDVKKIFEGLISCEKFNLLSIDEQLIIIEKLNCYSQEILLPNDFRNRYNNIERILLRADIEKINENIFSQLNDEELFLLEYLKQDVNDNYLLKEYIIDSIKNKGKSFAEFFEDIQGKQSLITKKIRNHYNERFYFNKVSLMEKSYHILLHDIDNEIIKEKLLKYLIIRIVPCNSAIDIELFYNTLKRNLNNHSLEYIDIYNLMSSYDLLSKEMKLTFYIKFNIALNNTNYLHGISLEKLNKINVKHINKLSKFLEDKTQDELSSIYGICIKLYFIFGYERSLEILTGKYGEYNRVFLDNVAKTDVSKVQMQEEGSKYLPIIDRRFINFMFETPKNNHFIDMLNNKATQLYKRWYYIYNNYDEILEKCHNEITLKKVNTILETEQLDIDKKLITPDNYKLNNNDFLENIILGNKTGRDNNCILQKIVEIYNEMKRRVESSIPYVEGVATNDYRYQMMKFDDHQIFELGYKANCCIRTLDIAHNHLLHAALCRNGRILLLYNKLGDLVAFCPLKRNGNVLIVNSIECIDKNSKHNEYILTSFNEAIMEIVDISKNSEEPIQLVCIGNRAYLKPTVVPFPDGYKVPTIFEKDDKVYKDTDRYHKSLDIVYMKDNFDLENIKSENPKVSYMDPRDEIKFVDTLLRKNDIEDAINVINSINYMKHKDNYVPINKYLIRSVYYSKDWYVADTYQGVIGECLDFDYRAKEEYDSNMNMLEKNDFQKTLKKIEG